jgi:hypothetical protein
MVSDIFALPDSNRGMAGLLNRARDRLICRDPHRCCRGSAILAECMKPGKSKTDGKHGIFFALRLLLGSTPNCEDHHICAHLGVFRGTKLLALHHHSRHRSL